MILSCWNGWVLVILAVCHAHNAKDESFPASLVARLGNDMFFSVDINIDGKRDY